MDSVGSMRNFVFDILVERPNNDVGTETSNFDIDSAPIVKLGYRASCARCQLPATAGKLAAKRPKLSTSTNTDPSTS